VYNSRKRCIAEYAISGYNPPIRTRICIKDEEKQGMFLLSLIVEMLSS
jgi:hypothetical protein